MEQQDSVVAKKKSVVAAVWNVISWALVLAVAILAILLVGVRVVGYTPYAILSPSMSPAYQVGDLVYVKECPPEQIEKGDALTFVANEQLLVVTHRVVEADRDNRWFITKGDANDSNDASPVLYENVLGVVEFSMPKLGYLSNYLTSTSGRYAGAAIICGLLLLLVLPEFFRKDTSRKGNED